MDKDNTEERSGSDGGALSRVSTTPFERALGNNNVGDNNILRIIPIGVPAVVAFHQLAVEKRKGRLDEHHA